MDEYLLKAPQKCPRNSSEAAAVEPALPKRDPQEDGLRQEGLQKNEGASKSKDPCPNVSRRRRVGATARFHLSSREGGERRQEGTRKGCKKMCELWRVFTS
jgi:hypothetical protein